MRLIGTASNRSAIGARIHVLATIGGQPVWQMREVSAQNSFNGHSDFTLHVGLGDAAQVEELRVHWPLGRIERFLALPPDTVITVVEGEDAPTPIAIALAASRLTARGVELTWHGTDGSEGLAAAVERRRRGGAWTVVGTPSPDGPERLTFVDLAVGPGLWAYRLRLGEGHGARFSPENWIEVPEPALSLAAAVTSARRLRLDLELPHAGPARIELFDASGRRLARRRFDHLAAGRRSLEVETPALAPGIYWVRLGHGGRAVAARALALP